MLIGLVVQDKACPCAQSSASICNIGCPSFEKFEREPVKAKTDIPTWKVGNGTSWLPLNVKEWPYHVLQPVHCIPPFTPIIKSCRLSPSPGCPAPGACPTGDGANIPPICGVIPAPSVGPIGVRDERKNRDMSFSPNLSRTQPTSAGMLNVSGAPVWAKTGNDCTAS